MTLSAEISRQRPKGGLLRELFFAFFLVISSEGTAFHYRHQGPRGRTWVMRPEKVGAIKLFCLHTHRARTHLRSNRHNGPGHGARAIPTRAFGLYGPRESPCVRKSIAATTSVAVALAVCHVWQTTSNFATLKQRRRPSRRGSAPVVVARRLSPATRPALWHEPRWWFRLVWSSRVGREVRWEMRSGSNRPPLGLVCGDHASCLVLVPRFVGVCVALSAPLKRLRALALQIWCMTNAFRFALDRDIAHILRQR